MKLFRCQCCAQLVYFENTICEKCGHRLGFLPEINDLISLEPKETGTFEPSRMQAAVTAIARMPILLFAIG
jgi:hypothetical protein